MEDTMEKIKQAYDRWKRAEGEWIEATLDLATVLREARDEHGSNNEFGAWLQRNSFTELGKDDRAALIGIGEHLELARQVIERSESRSVRLLWRELEMRLRSVAKTDSEQPEKRFRNVAKPDSEPSNVTELPPRICSKCNVNEAAFGHSWCKRCKGAPPAQKRKSSKPQKRLKPLPIAPPDSFLIALLDDIRRMRKEARDVKGRNKMWTHHGINIAEMRAILDKIEQIIDDKIQELTRAAS